MKRPADLPDYLRPPVTEVFLSVQFEELQAIHNIDAFPLWRRFESSFPKVEERPRIPPAFETFGSPGTASQPQITFLTTPPATRYWFISRDDTQIIQFQPDRLTHNWRKVTSEGEYPRYESIKSAFMQELQQLQDFLREERGITNLKPTQCEVTYINHIPTDSLKSNSPALIFRLLNNVAHPELGNLNDATFTARFLIKGPDGSPIGRLTADAREGITQTGVPIIQFTLTARGRPANDTFDAIGEFFDAGRRKIVIGFTEMTTESMHKAWGRTV